jgi:archaeal preflagellin peptidase FlaK
MVMTIIDQAQIAACLSMLALAAVIDIKKREIPDKIWIGFGGFGAVLLILEIISAPSESSLPFKYLLGIGIIAPIAYAIYKTSLFGGADSKALIAIAVLIPSLDSMPFKLHDLVALTVLSNALIISMSQVVYNSARNVISIARGVHIFEGMEHESTARKLLAFAMGYRSKSPKGYLFAMEGIDESGKRRFVFNPSKYDDFVSSETSAPENTDTLEAATVLRAGKGNIENDDGIGRGAADAGNNNESTWVTPALPFIVYIAIGLVITLTVGDLMAVVMQGLGMPTGR